LGIVFADYDRDGHLDIFVANDSMPEFLYHHKGDVPKTLSLSLKLSLSCRSVTQGLDPGLPMKTEFVIEVAHSQIPWVTDRHLGCKAPAILISETTSATSANEG
jgi:hypothetical protein